MPFITAIVSAIAAIGSFVVGGAGLGALTIGGISAGTLGSIGLAVGLSALNYALTPKNKASIGRVNDPGTRGNVRQAVPPQRFPYGTVQVGGAVFFLDDSKPPALYLGLLLSARPINRVLSVKLGTDIVTFASDMKALNAPYRAGVDCFLRGSFRLGASDHAIDPLLDEVFTNLDAEFRQRGSATAVFEFIYGDDREHFEELWGQVQIPNPFVLIEGALVYDPRDPTQLLDDATTWKWSDNATLVQADWAKHADGVGEDPADADWDRIAESANYDDEIVQLPDGSFQKRHTINGIVTLDQSPRDIMEALLTANRGSLRRSKGTWWIESSKPRDPIVTLTDRGHYRRIRISRLEPDQGSLQQGARSLHGARARLSGSGRPDHSRRGFRGRRRRAAGDHNPRAVHRQSLQAAAAAVSVSARKPPRKIMERSGVASSVGHRRRGRDPHRLRNLADDQRRLQGFELGLCRRLLGPAPRTTRIRPHDLDRRADLSGIRTAGA
jgi:hypothetical protein